MFSSPLVLFCWYLWNRLRYEVVIFWLLVYISYTHFVKCWYLVMLCSRVMTFLSEVGTIFLYLPLLKLQKSTRIQMFTTFLCFKSETSYLSHDFILGRRTFSEILGMTSRDDVMWQHVAYFCQFSSTKCWRQQKIFMVGEPYVDFWAEHNESFP